MSILDVLRHRAERTPDRTAYISLLDGESVERTLTYAQLHARVMATAGVFFERGLTNERVLISLVDGLDFLTAFLGLLQAGAVAVPVKLPSGAKQIDSTVGIARDCEAKAILASGLAGTRTQRLWTEQEAAPKIEFLDYEQIDLTQSPSHKLTPEKSLAYLQYTSGSTRAARGVMISHQNLISNLDRVQLSVRQNAESCSVQWLPNYHDMGLTSLLFAMHVGFPCVTLSPPQFLQRPVRWLNAISRYRATLSGGPCFAYQLCAERIREGDRAALDLSTWQTAYCGAEPVRESVYQQFRTVFGPHGFREDAFAPCYGLAEYVAAATAPEPGDVPHFLTIDADALRSGRVELCNTVPTKTADEGVAPKDETAETTAAESDNDASVSFADCGVAGPEDQLFVVDPETCVPCPERTLGEVWISGPSLPAGYWNRDEENRLQFAAKLHDGRGPFLRTGDLGFLNNGRLFVTGRMKDLIIIRGANYYPQDIEHAVERSEQTVRSGCAAAFAIERDGEEGLAIVAELGEPRESADYDRIFADIRTAVIEGHDIQPTLIVLAAAGAVPMTTSGKVRRQACRTAWLDGTLKYLALWQSPRADVTTEAVSTVRSRTESEIETWLSARLARRLGLNLSDINPTMPLVRYGLDSVSAVRIAGDLEEWLGRSLPPTLLYECRTVREAAQRLSEEATAVAGTTAGRGNDDEPIAIIGYACRFPGAPNADAFWELLTSSRDGIVDVPANRWDGAALQDPDTAAIGKMICRRGGFLPAIEQFDPGFFGISPREASRMDPQQRMLLETAWLALENAGIPPAQLVGSRTGTFVGIGNNDYAQVFRQYPDYLQVIDAHCGTGTAVSIAANRLAYIFDLRGPSMAVDTACSSASVALHLAVRSLRSGECDAALAGGVNAILSPDASIAFSKAQMLSPAGECRTFDAGAAGYVRSEGVGVVVLKRLRDALNNGDPIAAVIRGTAVNQDGRTSGITAPSPAAQQACIEAALDDAGLTVDALSYLEAHGTGTPLGDPIELQSLNALLARRDRRLPAVVVGSCKPNIGHTETASGIAGLIKVLLMLRHGQIPGQHHFEKLNPHIRIDDGVLEISASSRPWPSEGTPRTAGVSSFGFGGTNAHLIVEEWLQPAPAPRITAGSQPGVLVLSAHSEAALRTVCQHYADFLSAADAPEWIDVVHSSHLTRNLMQHRAAVVAADRGEAVVRLRQLAVGEPATDTVLGNAIATGRGKIAFLFTGQGSQYVGMGRGLYDAEPVFRRSLDASDKLLADELPVRLLNILFAEPGTPGAALINQTLYTQPALVALQRALTELWLSRGLRPDIVLGHSVGEYAAAAAAGAMSWDDALRLVARRARLMDSLPQAGAMLVVLGPQADVVEMVASSAEAVEVAAFNGPENVVVSGAVAEVAAFQSLCEGRGWTVHPLKVSHAFHSRLIEPMLDEFEKSATTISYHQPTVSLVSNVFGRAFGPEEKPSAGYWREHTRKAVHFADGMQALADFGADIFLELGPTPSLLNMARRCLGDQRAVLIPSLYRECDDVAIGLKALGTLFVNGAAIDWTAYEHGRPGRRVPLPNSVFERSHVWFDPGIDKTRSVSSGVSWGVRSTAHPLLGIRLPTPLSTSLFSTTLGLYTAPFLRDHVIEGSAVVPAAAYLEMALAAAAELFGSDAHTLEDVAFRQPMFIAEADANTVQTAVAAEAQGRAPFQIYRLPAGNDGAWAQHVTGTLRHGIPDAAEASPVDLTALRAQCSQAVEVDELFGIMHRRGLQYGPRFRNLREVFRVDGTALGRVQLSEALEHGLEKYLVHPALLDAAFQTLGVALAGNDPSSKLDGDAFLPVGVDKLVLYARPGREVWVRAKAREGSEAGADEMVGDLDLLDDAGTVLLSVRGLKLQRLGRAVPLTTTEKWNRWVYDVRWPEVPLSVSKTTPLKRWWILADEWGLGQKLAEKLRAAGHTCRLFKLKRSSQASRGATDENGHTNNGDVDFTTVDLDADAPFADLKKDNPQEIVHLWSYPELTPATPERFSRETTECELTGSCGTVAALALVQAFAGATSPPRLWFVTGGAQPVADKQHVDPAGAALWGFVRVVQNEHAEFAATLVDLDPCDPIDAAVATLLEELGADATETQVARRKSRHGARLERTAVATAAESKSTAVGDEIAIAYGPFRIQISSIGTLDGLVAQPLSRSVPASGQIELEIAAAALNFSDVLKVMGLYPGLGAGPVPLGIECAGTITAVGPGVEHLRVGQEVVAVAPFSFGTHTITAAYAVAAKPVGMSFVDAAALPIPYLTAYYALVRLAQIQPGERVLIHAAAGGVGLAAVQIVQHAGGIVYATAGSHEKREYLRSLGIEQVFDSRDPDFDQAVLEATGREGVDVVLNSLPGDAITKSIGLLRAYGRFLEIGKIDIYRDKQIGLYPFHNNLSYFAIDLDRLLRERPAYVQTMMAELMSRFEAGDYQALPATVFPASQIRSAFRYMQQRKNTGKIVVVPRVRESEVPADEASRPSLIRRDASYLITGGGGAIGVALAQRLVDRGAGGIWLVGRSRPKDDLESRLEVWRGLGVDVRWLQADVADAAQLAAALETTTGSPPLAGVFHAAGILDDAMIGSLDRRRVTRVAEPKIQGALNLHRLTLDRSLDHFVCFSSVAALFGSPGQANYAAANSWLDAFMQARRRLGLAGLSVNWGPWAAGGMAEAEGKKLAARGMNGLIPSDGLDLLELLMGGEQSQAAVMDVDWPTLLRMLPNGTPPLLAAFAQEQTAGEMGDDLRRQLVEAAPDTRLVFLIDAFRQRVARVLEVAPEKIDTEQTLNTLGLDSLMAVELRNLIQRSLQVTLPIGLFMEGPSIRRLAGYALEAVIGGRANDAMSDRAESAVDAVAGVNDGLNLELESVCDPDMRYDGPVLAAWSEEPRRILLTGATGFLGIHLLHELLTQTEATIVCLVRADSPERGTERLLQKLRHHQLALPTPKERIEAAVGDLAAPRWGLKDAQWKQLAGSVDRVYHCGAAVHFTQSYEQLRPANVEGVRDALRFALAERVKPLHYVSSLGIFTAADYGTRVLHEDDEVEIPKRLDGGYVQTKWVADKIMSTARAAGMPINIYRLGLLTGDTVYGRDDADGLIMRMVKSVVRMGTAPLTDVMVECTPVDYAARALVRLSLNRTLGRTFHLAATQTVPWNQLVDWLIELGFPIRKLPYDDWKSQLLSDVGRTTENAMSPLAPLLEASIDQATLWMADMSLRFSTTNVDAGLAGTGIECPKFDRDLLRRYVEYSLPTSFSSSSDTL